MLIKRQNITPVTNGTVMSHIFYMSGVFIGVYTVFWANYNMHLQNKRFTISSAISIPTIVQISNKFIETRLYRRTITIENFSTNYNLVNMASVYCLSEMFFFLTFVEGFLDLQAAQTKQVSFVICPISAPRLQLFYIPIILY